MSTAAWPAHMPRSLDYPRAGADAILAGAARAFPERAALVDGGLSLTYAELYDRARRVAGGLRERGIEPGDVVALHMPNSLWFLVAYYGAICAGAAVAPINPAQPVTALRRQLEDVEAKAVVSSRAGSHAVLEAGAPSVRMTIAVAPTAAAPAEAETPESVIAFGDLLAAEPLTGFRADPDSVAHLQLTGGTTGVTKAVRVLHRNLVANVLQVTCWRYGTLPYLDDAADVRLALAGDARHRFTIEPGTGVGVAIAPLFHGLGLVSQNMSALLGVTVHVRGRFDPAALLADIERLRVTNISGSPAMYYALLRCPEIAERDLSSVLVVNSGAAPMDTSGLRKLRAHFPNASVTEGYGLSEATMGLCCVAPVAQIEAPAGSVGIPVFDTQLELRGEDSVSVVPRGEVGEIWARGPQVAAGYLGHPDLTAQQFRDGWLRTGDMGRLDENGFLFLVGRAKDMIIYKGYNVYPQPLEELLCSHPAVAQAAVVGAPNPEAGEIPVGFVVLRPGIERREGLAEELLAHVAAQVAPYQKVRALHVLDALPMTATGKVLKTELRARLLAPATTS